ncbi:D-glycerate dehydrogenase [Kitasatospora herbaricolor]|uniref:2-hydroxyacid dehydrogenase n=1 Tax=Kitasatospora herbaricolor TaxID=68217 RepID=UPI00174B9293|nr:D-glycerate dehydrogenase [Kitasatospora herbaricolor]MDQ0310128.1 glyoxylate reductase [Kitasatospora herbaricolor]GGV17932.1 D-glycerate dehydrogenase [Kitasatospora herbaricolor]
MSDKHLPPVLVTRRLAPGVTERLAPSCAVTLHDDVRPMERAALLKAVHGRAAVITTLDDVVDDEFLDAAGPSLRIVANHAVGTHNIDLAACAARGVPVSNTPGVLTAATADMAWALLLAATRRLGEGERLLRSGQSWAWAPTFLLGMELAGAPLGILGMGRIGQAVARRAAGFDMPVSYHNRTRLPAALEGGSRWLPLDELLAGSAVLVVTCPLSAGTRHLLDARRLALLPAGAVVVSMTAGVVDERALAAALESGALSAAAVDNFEHEPAVPAELLAQERAVLAPHLGSATVGTRQAMGGLAVDNVLAVLAGGAPLTPVAAG